MHQLLKSFINEPKHIHFEGEDGDEEILFAFRKAMITNIGWLFSTIILALIPFLLDSFLYETKLKYPNIVTSQLIFIVNAFWFIFILGFVFERFLNWFFNVYIITNKRIVDMDFDHLLHRNISEAPLRNVEDTTYTISGTFQTLFNVGDISIQTAAEKRELEFFNVANPAKIQDMLSDLVASVKEGYKKQK